MTYQLQILPSAEKEIAALAPADRARVDGHIRALATEPRPPGIVAVKGLFRGCYRLRVGDYRIIYRVRDAVLTVLVVKVGHRREVYR